MKASTNSSLWGIDFETYSELSLPDLGVYRYVEGAYAGVHCIAWDVPGDDYVRLWNPYEPQLSDEIQELFDYVASGGLLRAFNAEFEYVIWNRLFVRDFVNMPRLRIEQLRCTQAQAAAKSIRRHLAGACEDLGLPAEFQKDKRGKQLIQKLCCPQKPTRNQPHEWLTYDLAPEMFVEIFEYCKQDVVAEREVSVRLPALSAFEQKVWETTLRINERGVPLDRKAAAVIASMVEEEKELLNLEASELSGGVLNAVTEIQRVTAWLRTQGVETESLDAEHVHDILLREDISKETRRMLEIRQLASQTSVAKFKKVGEIVCKDDTMKGLLTYYGAGPGRFSSQGGLNIQNLKRPTIKGIESYLPDILEGDLEWFRALHGPFLQDFAPSAVRAMVRAPKGSTFMVVDYKAIENRSAPWLVGDEAKLEVFRAGFDEYIWFSAHHLHNVRPDRVTDDMRKEAKSACLGCLYGQAAKGYVDYAAKNGIILEFEQAKHAVDSWRSANKMVVKFWYSCDDMAKAAIREPGKVFKTGRLKFCASHNWLQMMLPSGRKISFFKPLIELIMPPWGKSDEDRRETVTIMSINTHTRQWGRNPIIGSSFFQSANQGNARDVMVYGMMKEEEHGYAQVMTVHDELVAQVRKGFGSLGEYMKLAVDVPSIYDGFPLDVEGYEAEVYKK